MAYVLIGTHSKIWREITDIVFFRTKLVKFLQGDCAYGNIDIDAESTEHVRCVYISLTVIFKIANANVECECERA